MPCNLEQVELVNFRAGLGTKFSLRCLSLNCDLEKNFYSKDLALKGATKSYFTYYSFVVFILCNTGLCKSVFSTNSCRKLVFLSFCAFCLFCLLCVEFDVIFINFITFAQSLFIQVSHVICVLFSLMTNRSITS